MKKIYHQTKQFLQNIRVQQSIQLKLSIMLIIVTTLLLSGFGFYQYSGLKASKIGQLNDLADRTIERLAEGLVKPVWEIDRIQVEKLVLAEMREKQIVLIQVKDYKQRIVAHKGRDKKWQVVDIRDDMDGDFIIRRQELIQDDSRIGTALLYLTPQFMQAELRQSILTLIVTIVCLDIVLLFILSLSVNKSFVGPVLRLARVSKEVADNYDFSIKLENASQDEIGVLYSGFNKMLENIRLRDAELQKTKNYLNSIIESMPSMLISINDQGIIEQWNTAAEKLTGIRASEVMGKKLWETIPLLGKFEKHYSEVIRTRQPLFFTREKLENMAEGKNKYYNVALYPLIAKGISGLVVRIDDISDMEKKDEQLRQSQKMETVGTLAGGLAHDFNNVLGGIVGTISILKFKLNKGLDIPVQALKDYVETIERAGQRAADMVQQLLTLSRKQELSFAPVDLNLTIKHVFKICSNTIDKSVELKSCYTKEPAMVNADPGQMEQVLLNLSVNAGHAMTIMKKPGEHQGGVLTLSLRILQADKFFCSSHPEAQEITYWVMSVQDTGTGMDSKTVAKIFDPFFTTKEKGKGTGLGLAMVYNIVQQHKGFIDVYSEIGLGTTFSVYLPSIEGVQGDSLCQEEMKIARGEGVILVVDDEAIMRELAQEILTECGYQVLLAENGEEGVDVFRKEHKRIDMVLLDMVMPKKSGKETFIEMKKIDPNVKVLLASGFRKDERVEEIINLGLTGFIQKPYTIEKLAEVVCKAMKG